MQPEETNTTTACQPGKSTDVRKEEQMAAGEKAENEKSENAESHINTEREAASDTDEASKTRGTDSENPTKTPSESLSEDEKTAQNEPEIIPAEDTTVEEMTPERLEETVKSLIRAAGFEIYSGERKEKADLLTRYAVSAIFHIREQKWEVAQSAAIELAKAAGRMAEIEKELFLEDDE